MLKKYISVSLLILTVSGIISCRKLLPQAPDSNEVLAEPINGLSGPELAVHLRGDEAFARVFSQAEGLGPIFVQASCESCHAGDGMGSPENALTRFGRFDGFGMWDNLAASGGPQLQHRSVLNYQPESIPASASGITKFIAPNVTGMGYLEAVDDNLLISLADTADADGDGISGKLRLVAPPPGYLPRPNQVAFAGPSFIGRFGRKAQVIDLTQQTTGAYREDMGITSALLPDDPVNFSTGGIPDEAADPEIPLSEIKAVVFYLQTLEAPRRRNQSSPEVLAGEQLFEQIGCAACHVPKLKTGPSNISVLNLKDFYPYTDLLLHDMGSELNDGFGGGDATTFVMDSEWRTSPLWGLGLQHDSQGGQLYLLHDGRANDIPTAVDYHGGEGAASRTNFQQLSETEKEKIIQFILSL